MKTSAKRTKDNQKENDERVEVHVEEFIPYACHFDERTLLTKNGELLQVIKITGFNFETVKDTNTEPLTLREAIRKAISDSVTTNNFAFWFHTVRRKKSISPGGNYPPGFSQELNEAWCERHDWDHKFINELYITILAEGESLSIADLRAFLRHLYFPSEFRYRKKSLEKSAKALDQLVGKIVKSLQDYGAHRLQVKNDEGIYYSEITQFLGKIINLSEVQIPLSMVDLSEVLPSHKIAFGFNVVEVRGDTGTHFGAILSVKEYHEISTNHIDEFLQLPQEFIISETFDFVNQKKALKHFEEQYEIQQASEDTALTRASGLDQIMKSDKGSAVDFGEHQITVMVLADDLQELEYELQDIVNAFHDLGIVVIREDIFMEDCYWAQLPGNFEFIKRLSPINTLNIGGYSSLYNFPAGKLADNHWGPAVTVFYTAMGTPYFFNFHYNDNGHTMIIGPYGSGKTVLLNFLVAEARKFNNRLIYFDQQRGAEIFIRSISGNYQIINKHNKHLRFNPLQLKDTPENRSFLTEWLGLLIKSVSSKIDDETQETIKKAIDYTYSLEQENRKLSEVIPKFWPLTEKEVGSLQKLKKTSHKTVKENKESIEEFEENTIDDEIQALLSGSIGRKKDEKKEEKLEEQDIDIIEIDPEASLEERLTVWYGDGGLAYLFDNSEDYVSLEENQVLGLDFTRIITDNIPILPVVYYLFHRIEAVLDGSPCILVLDEAWNLIDNDFFAPVLEDWLEKLRKKNTMVIFATESVDDAERSSITKTLTSKIETQIFLPNPDATEAYIEVFGLSQQEFWLLNSMSSEWREFLLKHNIDAVVAELNLGGMEYELAVLAADEESLTIMEESILEAGEDPSEWLPAFKDRVLE